MATQHRVGGRRLVGLAALVLLGLTAAGRSAAESAAAVDPRSVAPMLRAGDVVALEARLDELETTSARTRDGWLALPCALAALGYAAASDTVFATPLANWTRLHPDSWKAAMVEGWRHLAFGSSPRADHRSFEHPWMPAQRDLAALERAATAFERAAWLVPRSAEPAAGLLVVATLRRAPLDERIAIFDRGCRVDRVCETARVMMLTSLEPHLGGSREALVGFARASVAEHPDDPRIGLLLAFAHRKVALTRRDRAGYFREPGVFEEVERAYERFLSVHPDALLHRNEYARAAAWAGRREIASREFLRIGDGYVDEAWKGDFREFLQKRAWALETSAGASLAEAAR